MTENIEVSVVSNDEEFSVLDKLILMLRCSFGIVIVRFVLGLRFDPQFVIIAGYVSFLAWNFAPKKQRVVIRIIQMSGWILSAFVLNEKIFDGILAILNRFISIFVDFSHEIILPFVVHNDTNNLFWCWFFCGYVMCITTSDMKILNRITFIPILAVSAVSGMIKPIIFVYIYLCIIYHSKLHKCKELPLISIAYITICVCVFFTGVCECFSRIRVDYFKEHTLTRYENIKQENNSIVIRMENPQPLYFRLYSENDISNASDWVQNFYTLRENNFCELTMAGNLSKSVNCGNYSEVSIKCDNSNLQDMLIPYGTSECYGGQLKYLIGDTKMFSSQAEYSFKIVDNFLQSEAEFGDGLSIITDENSEYLSLEQQYRQFVYAQYLGLSEDENKAISEKFSLPNGGDLAKIKSEIFSFVSENVTADNSSECVKLSNIANRILRENGTANEYEYAILTAEMFRFCSVPARTVFGFAISDELADSVEPYGEICVNTQDFHYWCEYYCDGVGWIPFETYPDYVGIFGGNQQSEFTESTTIEPPHVVPETVENNPYLDNISTEISQKNHKISVAFAVLICLFGILLSLFAVALAAKYFRKRKAFSEIGSRAEYYHFMALRLLGFCGVGGNTFEDISESISKQLGAEVLQAYCSSEQVIERFKFSDRLISDADCFHCKEFYILANSSFKRDNSIVRRLFFSFIMIFKY